MPAFQYQAVDKTGGASKGVIESDSERGARQLLRDKSLIPISIVELKVANKTSSFKIKSADLSLFTRQLATLLSAGLPVEESLRGTIEQTEKEKTRQLMTGVRAKVVEGYSLAQAMGEFPSAFPEMYVATVGAGEQTGRLDVVLEKLADYTEHQQQTKQKVKQALIYPILMVIVSVTIISFLLAFVVPKIIEVFSNSGQSLPTMTKILISISDFVKIYGIYLLGFIIICIFALKKSLKNLKVRLIWDKLMLKMPFTSYFIRITNGSRYIHTFSILFAAGVNILETMRVSSSLLNNLIMREAFDEALVKVREGGSIAASLKATKFLSPMAIHLIASGEKSGLLADMMQRAALHMDLEVKNIIDTLLTLLEPLIILIMGTMVLFIVLATLLPIFSMEQLVT